MIVTHAHTDHTGALPLVLPYIGDALIHMTTGTLHVLEVLQVDAVRHQKDGDDEAEGAVSYSADDVERMISRVVPHTYRERFCPVPGREDIQIQFIACGHVLGAGMLVIDTPEGRILWTGDYSVSPQPTVGGVDLEHIRALAEERPFRFMVTEGTYGSEVHPPRELEEKKLIRKLEQATRRGGMVLIPAFAVGRSQDIGVLIRRAKQAGKLQDVAVYFDGMVRGITTIYQSIAHEIYPHITEPLEILDPEMQMYRANGQSRAKLVSGEIKGPAIVISSSGMLIGGRSVEYAAAFAPGRRNALLITGYTDEESPGRAIQKLKRGGRLRLGDKQVRVRCDVRRYGLSAHADFAQVCAVVEAANPERLAVVHGDPGSLKKFAAAMKKVRPRQRTVILKNGETLKVAPSRRSWTPPPVDDGVVAAIVRRAEERRINDGPSGMRMPSDKEVREVWHALVSQAAERMYSEHEICRMFLGSGYRPEDREELSKVLSNHRLFFLTGSATGQRSYRPRPEEEVVEMMIERGNAYQVPVSHGDVVTFCDGSTDIFVAIADRPEGNPNEVPAVVAQSPRRAFRREWMRASSGVNAAKMLTGHRGMCARWLEELVREARKIEINGAELYHQALEAPDRRITVSEAFAMNFPEGHDHPDAAHLAIALALSGADRLFRLEADGAFAARPESEVAERWDAFEAYRFVRSLPEGTPIQLSSGQSVLPTGVRSMRSFEARTEDGAVIRCNYRRVDLNGPKAA